MEIHELRKLLNQGKSIYNIHLKVTSYARVSTESDAQKSSLSNQVDHFEDLIRSNTNWTYVQGYVDEGISGIKDFKRESFMQMINDAKLGLFDLVITKEISRFSRNTLDSIKYSRLLLDYGVAVFFVSDNINTAQMDAELRLTIMASLAQDEIRRLSERVKFGMAESIRRGHILGNNMLYGYKKNKNKEVLEINESEALMVIRLFTLYGIEKYSLKSIANIFNEEEIPTVQNKKWCASTLSRMIRNPKYKGYYCAKKSEVVDFMSKKVKKFNKNEWVLYKDTNKIPPIISEELWEIANQKLESRGKKFSSDTHKYSYLNRYPLSAKLICANDLQVYHRKKNLKASDDITWMCSSYLSGGKSVCLSANIRESELMEIFDNLIINLNEYLLLAQDKLKSIYNNILNKREGIDNRIIDDEIDKIMKKKEKILELNIDGCLSNQEFKKNNDKLNKLINNLREKQKRVDNEVLEKLNDSFYEIIGEQKITEMLIDLLIDRIYVKRIDTNNIKLNMIINDSYMIINKYLSYSYQFKRGYNTRSTKRYIVNYEVILQNKNDTEVSLNNF